MKCSIFTDFQNVSDNRSFEAILDSIRDGSACGEKIHQIRQLLESNAMEAAAALKKSLPAFTPAGMFDKKRSKSTLSFYSGIVHLDLDHIPSEDFNRILELVTACEYTLACFHSASGHGLKIFIKVSSGSTMHESATKAVSDYYSTLLNFEPDPVCKDISRLCFGSHDPDLYYNQDCAEFTFSPRELKTMDSPKIAEPPFKSIKAESIDALFAKMIDFTNRKGAYVNGNRNNYLHVLACNCNRFGLPESEVRQLSMQYFDLPATEIWSTFESAYKNNQHEFAMFTNHSTLQNAKADVDYLSKTPIIPQSVFDSLPRLLKMGCAAFSDERERDVFLTGALTILSACLPNVQGEYYRQIVYPNLFSFILAPPASGKGVLVFAKQMGMHYHLTLIDESDAKKKAFELELEAYYSNCKKNKDATFEMPEKPPFKVLFIPANASCAKILQHLKENNGSGIICETEADSMGNAFKQDWGNYSDMLRKSFHHESISSSKKNNNEFIEVNYPKLSVVLSGTPNQVANLISSVEDGLFSRFLFYAFKANQGWKDVSPSSGGFNLTELFSSLALETYSLVQFLSNSPTDIQLTDSQWTLLNEQCANWLDSTTIISGEETASIVKRLGLIMYRLAMLFTALRKFEKGDNSITQFCSDDDFRNAMLLTGVYLEHSILMFSNLPKQASTNQFRQGSNKQLLIDSLPDEFRRMDAVAMGENFHLSTRTVDEILRVMTNDGKLHSPKAGYYTKVTE